MRQELDSLAEAQLTLSRVVGGKKGPFVTGEILSKDKRIAVETHERSSGVVVWLKGTVEPGQAQGFCAAGRGFAWITCLIGAI